jgi:hypothetical protein
MLNEPPPSQQSPYYAPPQPAIWPWFLTYCGVMALMYLVLAGAFAIPVFLSDAQLAGLDSDEDPVVTRITCGVMAVICFPLFVAYGVAPFLPKRPWVWIYDIVLICISMTSVCCLPIGIPLLIYWLKEETQVFFGRSRRTAI